MKSYTFESVTRFTDGIVYVALVGTMLVSLSNLAVAENVESNDVVPAKTQVHEVTELPATAVGNISHQAQLLVPNIQQQLQLKIEAKMQQQLNPVKVNQVASR
ncbi:hypothetical protein R50073_39130 [Maricurvus nonylphenolicus]|uniref:hypothetical protein n=1 Tax=Maricurvus nonylphenolicus TaxID=1008307 RepID=UPI0036F337FA